MFYLTTVGLGLLLWILVLLLSNLADHCRSQRTIVDLGLTALDFSLNIITVIYVSARMRARDRRTDLNSVPLHAAC